MTKGKLTASEIGVLRALVAKRGAKAVLAAIDDAPRRTSGRPPIERGDEMTAAWLTVEIFRRRAESKVSVKDAAAAIAEQRMAIMGRTDPTGAIIAVKDEKNRIYRSYFASNRRAADDPAYRQWRETIFENIELIQKNLVH